MLSAVCEDELEAILLIQTDSLMLKAQIIPVVSRHVGGSSGDETMHCPLMSRSVHVGGGVRVRVGGGGRGLMRRDMAKFIEEQGMDEERGIIDWPFAYLHLRGPIGNVKKGFEYPGGTFVCQFPCSIKDMMVSRIH